MKGPDVSGSTVAEESTAFLVAIWPESSSKWPSSERGARMRAESLYSAVH